MKSIAELPIQCLNLVIHLQESFRIVIAGSVGSRLHLSHDVEPIRLTPQTRATTSQYKANRKKYGNDQNSA